MHLHASFQSKLTMGKENSSTDHDTINETLYIYTHIRNGHKKWVTAQFSEVTSAVVISAGTNHMRTFKSFAHQQEQHQPGLTNTAHNLTQSTYEQEANR